MSARKWDVWSIQRKDCSGLVVVEGVTEKAARDAADAKNGAAARQAMTSVAFVALTMAGPRSGVTCRRCLEPEPEPEKGRRAARRLGAGPVG